MGEKPENEDRRKIVLGGLAGAGLTALKYSGLTALANLFIPSTASAIVSVKYLENPEVHEKYIEEIAQDPNYPDCYDLTFKIPENVLEVPFMRDPGSIGGQFRIYGTPDYSEVEAKFTHPKESRIISMIQEKYPSHYRYLERITQLVPSQKTVPFEREFSTRRENVGRLNIPNLVQYAMKGRLGGSGFYFQGKKLVEDGVTQKDREKEKLKLDYMVTISESSDKKHEKIISGNVSGGSDLDNIKVFFRKVNDKYIPVKITGDYTIHLGRIFPDSIKLRADLTRPKAA